MNYKIINGTLLLYKDGVFTVEKDSLYIIDGIISAIGDKPENGAEYEIIDASGRLIMPGIINMHTHAYMTAMRNMADDVPFGEWLFNRIMPVEDRLTKQQAYYSSLLGCMEMIQTGTTCFLDMHMFEGRSAKAAGKAGMRAYIGRGLVGEDLYTDGLSRLEEFNREIDKYSSDLVKFMFAPHAVYSCSEKLYSQAAQEAKRRGMLKQTHASESEQEVSDCLKKYGRTPVELLYDSGFLDGGAVLAHCVKLTDNDLDILKKTGSTAVTNPASNAKLGNGIAPVEKMLENGINVCVGTDSTASNNTLNMFREMGLLSMLHKGRSGSPVALLSQQVLTMALINSAKALGMENRLGVIKEGAYADLVFINLNSVSLFPNNNIVSSLVYSANGSEVESVMINGKFVMYKKEYPTIDTERVMYESGKIL
ncbi:MAG: amidohydrolase [Clostridia bacterium]|nr:amidohydrolase [Clostridia bacterium]